jgi:Zn-finger in ubiquitin-hydrolases and other protein
MSGWTVQREDGGSEVCEHAAAFAVRTDDAEACEDCVREGTRWVHLRRCLECDHVGCCDNSPRRHATAHWQGTSHPVVSSAEPREQWAWCYPDEVLLVPAESRRER